MKNKIYFLAGGICFLLISAAHKTGEPPIHTFRVGNSIVSEWENEGKLGKWSNFQIQKEYTQHGVKKWSNFFTREELIDLKTAIEQALAEKETK